MTPIPADQPFVVRTSHRRRALLLGVTTLVAVAGSAGIVGWTVALGWPVMPILAVLLCPAALFVPFLAIQIYQMTRPGVLLTAGPTGIWFTSDIPPTPLTHLRWEDIERVSIQHWRLLDRRLVVTPSNPYGNAPGGGRGLVRNLYGGGFSVRISLVDGAPADILTALAHYSAGRCAIG